VAKIRVGSGDIAYDEAGSGPPVILVMAEANVRLMVVGPDRDRADFDPQCQPERDP
jgi:hypothetical protein